MPTIFLSLRGDDASRALESFRRALGEDAQSLVVVPTNDESGYHGSAEVGDVTAAREAFALARKPFPTLRAYMGAGGRDEPPPRQSVAPDGEGQGRRGGESRGRATERQSEGRPEGRGRGQEARGQDGRAESRSQERSRERDPAPDGEPRESRRTNSRGRNRGGRRPQGSEPREGRAESN